MQQKTAFSKWIDEIQMAKFPKVRDRIVNECKVTTSCFYQWRTGKSTPSPLAQDTIDRIALEETGEPVFRKGGEA